MADIDWQFFDSGRIALRRCALCRNQTKFDSVSTESYYCARLKRWTAPVFECPFWEAQAEWREWYVYCTKLRRERG